MVAGLLATDDIGVVSLLLFWGMLELGVGMIAICLPAFRPLFAGWSPESILRSIRSVITLRSTSSSRSSTKASTGRSNKGRHRLGSESSTMEHSMDTIPSAQYSTAEATTKARGFDEHWKPIESPKDGYIRQDLEFTVRRQQV